MKTGVRSLILAAGALSLGVACSTLVVDRSMPAVQAGDFTLAISACQAVPGRGMDLCRVKENAAIESVLRLIVPAGTAHVRGGEITLYYRDVTKTFAIKDSPLIEIPWKEFFGADKWSRAMDGEVLALAEVRYETPEGLEEIWRARGVAKIIVTREGYDPLPLDSGFSAWAINCKIDYSTAGRSDVKCK